jgi:hypothetical protein
MRWASGWQAIGRRPQVRVEKLAVVAMMRLGAGSKRFSGGISGSTDPNANEPPSAAAGATNNASTACSQRRPSPRVTAKLG